METALTGDLPGGEFDVEEDVLAAGHHVQIVRHHHDLPDVVRRRAQDDY